MNEAIFIDTSFFIALCNEEDKNFKNANLTNKRLLQEFKKGKISIYYSDYIFDELITTLKAKGVEYSKIKKFGGSIKKSKLLNMIFITQKIFDQTWKLILKYQDKEWSFTDASTFKIMENFDIKYYLSYDIHFSQFPKILSWKAEPK
jgi:hypothetical protein